MSQEARIHSILVLTQLRASLGTFAEIASAALEEASTEIQRTRQWLEGDRSRHWKKEVQTRSEQMARARIALKQKQVFDRTLAGTPTSCVDEKKALKKAEARFQEAEHKLSRVRAWTQQLEKEMSDYRGATQRLLSAVEVDIPNARARLDKMIDALEAYIALAPPEMPRGDIEAGGGRPEGEGVPLEPAASGLDSQETPQADDGQPQAPDVERQTHERQR